MKVVLLTNGFFPFVVGGIQKHSYYLAKYWAAQQINVVVYTSGITSQQDMYEQFSESERDFLEFRTVEFPKGLPFPGHYVYNSYRFSKNIFAALENETAYDAIYAQGFTSWYFLKKARYNKKILTNLHGLEMFQAQIDLKNRFANLLLSIPTKAIIRNSFRQVSLGGRLTDILYAQGARQGSVVEIPNAVEKSWLVTAENSTFTHAGAPLRLIFVGRYERRKGIEEFTAVIRKTIKELRYEVQFIGPIPDDKRISDAAITYSGVIKDPELIKKQLSEADILVCPSYSEGMPTVILEAMSCGCAIIATDVGAVNTMVGSDNGWLIGTDIEQGLETALREAAATNLDAMKKASIKKVRDHFTWDVAINLTNKFLPLNES
jgi:glycosyltransferase involved in cell wall biosynthesis